MYEDFVSFQTIKLENGKLHTHKQGPGARIRTYM